MHKPGSCRRYRAATFVAALAALLSMRQSLATEPTATVIEFYNAALDHYFITAFAQEAAMISASWGSVLLRKFRR